MKKMRNFIVQRKKTSIISFSIKIPLFSDSKAICAQTLAALQEICAFPLLTLFKENLNLLYSSSGRTFSQ